MARTKKQIALCQAKTGSGLAAARLRGMKIRAQIDPPRAAIGTFPYPHRTCAEWEELPTGQIVDRQLTDDERVEDAISGSERLKIAIFKAIVRQAA